MRIVVALLFAASIGSPQGIITTIAGTSFAFSTTPLAALSAPLSANIQGVAVDAAGNF